MTWTFSLERTWCSPPPVNCLQTSLKGGCSVWGQTSHTWPTAPDSKTQYRDPKWSCFMERCTKFSFMGFCRILNPPPIIGSCCKHIRNAQCVLFWLWKKWWTITFATILHLERKKTTKTKKCFSSSQSRENIPVSIILCYAKWNYHKSDATLR